MSIRTPDWVKHAVFYQIFPDAFAKGAAPAFPPGRHRHCPTPPSDRLEPWDAPPTFQGIKGGNLWGIIEKLDYLKDLGVTALYLTPVFQSASNHRYHTHDYYQIDPALGGQAAFEALRDQVHRRDMRLILDGVFNHASRGFFMFNDILENGGNSVWLDWFKIRQWPLAPYDGSRPANYESWTDYRALPQFNHDNPQVREYIMQVGEYWIRQGIDGWRLDVPFCVKTPGFWAEFRQRVKALNPDAYIVGEVWGDGRPWLDGTQFDGVMNYIFAEAATAFVAGDRVQMPLVEDRAYRPYPSLDAAGYARKIEALLALYDWEIQLAQLNLLDSHDTARLLSIAGGDAASVELATLLMFAFPGPPCIYYGNEVGLPGGLDPDSRRGFPDEDRWDRRVLDYHRRLTTLRRDLPALRTGDYRTLYAEGMTYVCGRTLGAEMAIAAVNGGDRPATATVRADATWPTRPDRVAYGAGEARWQLRDGADLLELTLPPRQGLLLR